MEEEIITVELTVNQRDALINMINQATFKGCEAEQVVDLIKTLSEGTSSAD